MKLLTITQPWAQLIALGVKRIETRPKQTLYRGDVAIHAAKGLNGIFEGAGELDLAEACSRPYIVDALGRHRITSGALPRGHVVAVARLVRCTLMTEGAIAKLAANNPAEHAFGFYKPGRWAWVFEDVRPLERPYKLRGQQMLADIEPEKIEHIRRLAIELTGARA
jgi:activating signal cointegrator 1